MRASPGHASHPRAGRHDVAVAFSALGLQGIRRGVLYGLFVCGGLLALLAVCPNAQSVLFPLTWVTVLMASVGHAVYGALLGAIAEWNGRRRHLSWG